MAREISRRRFLGDTLVAGALSLLGRPGRGRAKARPPLVVLGFDGVDPRLVERFASAGKLPHLSRLAANGTLTALESTSPPNSPVAWSTFSTGLEPAQHGVFGFLTRDPATYLPRIAPYTIQPPRFAPYRPPVARSNRQGRDFWLHLDAAGVSTTLLYLPYAYPPHHLQWGRSIAGLGVSDLRFTNSSFTFFSEAEGRTPAAVRVAGGRKISLVFTKGRALSSLPGPWGPDSKPLATAIAIEKLPGQAARVVLDGRSVDLQAGKPSAWLPVLFSSGVQKFFGRVRLLLLAARPRLQLYCSPIQIDPDRPALPVGHPQKWCARLVNRYHLPTVGWVHDTSAVNAGVLPPRMFEQLLLDTMEARCRLLLGQMRVPGPDLLLAVFTGTDRAAHMFYRELQRGDGGALGRVYAKMDEIIGRVRKRLPGDARLVVLSDHGFHPFNRQMHLNTWLEEQGWLVRRQPRQEVRYLRGVDWSKTRLYALGNGQIFLNLAGREAQGIVKPGNEARGLLAQARQRLLEVRDPQSGARPIREVLEVSRRAAASVQQQACDLQVAFAPGWRSSWKTSLGGVPGGPVFLDNNKAWCGDHAASHQPETPGFIASNLRLRRTDPRILDLANSILESCGVGSRGTGPGRALW